MALVADGRVLAGEDSWPASRTVDVVDDEGEVVGGVVVGVPLDDALADRLARATALQDSDVLAIADEGRTLAAWTFEPGAALPDRAAGLHRTGRRDVSLRLDPAPRGHGRQPGRALARGAGRRRRRPDPAACLLRCPRHGRARPLLAAGTIRLGPAAPRSGSSGGRRGGGPGRRSSDVRRSGDERRVREAVALVGEALAATHDPEALLPVILQSAIEATGAAGARVVSGGTEVVRAVGRRRAAAR